MNHFAGAGDKNSPREEQFCCLYAFIDGVVMLQAHNFEPSPNYAKLPRTGETVLQTC